MSNTNSAILPDLLSVSQCFSLCASLYPERIAVEYKNIRLDYQSLELEATALAGHLHKAGVEKDSLVAVYLHRSPQLIIALLAILKTGAAYSPIDPSYPPERIALMLEAANVDRVLTSTDYESKVCAILPRVQVLTIEDTCTVHRFSGSFEDCSSGSSLAYVMFTSGSTGKPKGVMIGHESIVDLVTRQNFVRWHPGSSVLSTGSPSFDATTFEYWGPLLNGGRLVLCNEKDVLDPKALALLIRRHKINMMWFTAGLFHQLVDADIALFAQLDTVIAGGDRLSVPHVRKFRSTHPGIQLVNGYGPTEGCTFSLTHPVQDVPDTGIPIGRPLNNRCAFVLNENLEPCGPGETGELFIGGSGLAQGYLNEAVLTADRFMVIELLPGNRMRLYRTGDLCRKNDAGLFEFMGRADDQVKISGYRVEPAEIERTIRESGIVADVLVLATDDGGAKRLVAFIKPLQTGNDVARAVNDFLKKRLPAYMIPREIFSVETWPLMPNGKVDREKLLKGIRKEISSSLPADQTQGTAQEKMLAIWKQLLQVPHVKPQDDFFDLGGHSLLLVKLSSEISKTFGRKIPAGVFFDNPTVEKLVQCLEENATQEHVEPAAPPAVTGVTASEKVFFLRNKLYPGEYFPNSSVVYEMLGDVDMNRLESCFVSVIRRHDALRTHYHYDSGEVYAGVQKNATFRMFRMETTESDINTIIANITKPFVLSEAPLLRVTCISISDDRQFLYVDMPHINSDGLTLRIMIEEVVARYCALPVSEAELSFDIFRRCVQQFLASEQYVRDKQFWLGHLKGAMPVPVFVQKRPTDCNGVSIVTKLPEWFAALMWSELKITGLNRFQFFLAAFVAFKYQWTGSRTLFIQMPVHNRNYPGCDQLIGLCANTMLLRFELDDEMYVADFLQQCRQVLMQVLPHQAFPFENLQKEWKASSHYPFPAQDISFFNYHHVEAQYNLGDGALKRYTHIRYKEVLPLSIDLYDDNTGLELRLLTAHFTAPELQRFAGEYVDVAGFLLNYPEKRLKAFRPEAAALKPVET